MFVIPAKAGIHFYAFRIFISVPAQRRGMKCRRSFTRIRKWIPAFAGMTAVVNSERRGVFQQPFKGE
ncbi:MAG: hypothetical protein OXE44_20070 [Nitrospinae bacterium]|nr:hypothetical protein [Nitrospinota bacterium]